MTEGHTTQEYEAFADRNFERYNRFHCDGDDTINYEQDIVEIDCPDFAIVHPFLSECARFKVDPVEHYGLKEYAAWMVAADAAMARGL